MPDLNLPPVRLYAVSMLMKINETPKLCCERASLVLLFRAEIAWVSMLSIR